MKPYIQYLAEKHYNFDEQTNNDLQAAADKYSDYRLAEFIQWKDDNFNQHPYVNGYTHKNGKKPNKVYTTSELIAIFNSETNGRTN